MTNAEYFNQLCKAEEEPHIQSFKMIMAELMQDNPTIDFSWCLPKYKRQIEWLNKEWEDKL